MVIKNRSRICLIISAVIMVIALIMTICGSGINQGLDFTGGLSMQYDLNPALSEKDNADASLDASAVQADTEAALNAMDVSDYTVTVQGAKNNIVNIRLKGFSLKAETEAAEAVAETAAAAEEAAEPAEAAETKTVAATEEAAEPAEAAGTETETAAAESAEVSEATAEETAETDSSENEEIQNLQRSFEEKIHEKYPDAASFGDVSYVGPVAGATLLKNAILSVLIATVLMLIYIAIRFDFNSGLSAVFGLVHDVLIMLSFMVIFRSFIQMNSSFIAAALTIVGYSINNTIVIFDRIRENAKKMPTEAREEITNRSIKECLGRTICTTATTLITIVALCILGVASIREFALPIIIGILSGVYSANMINGYVWAFLEEKRRNRKVKA